MMFKRVVVKVTVMMTCLFSLAVASVLVAEQQVSDAEVFGNHRIIAVNGEVVDVFNVLLPQGQHQLSILYETYQYDVRCDFDVYVKSGERYEAVTHASELGAMKLYRWQASNIFWSKRLTPALPQHCERQAHKR